MAFDHYVMTGTKRLRCGYTTGSCAAMAAGAATTALLTGEFPDRARIKTPAGICVEADVLQAELLDGGARAVAAIRKDGGDDVDATDGMLVFAEVRRADAPDATVLVDGGPGVGRVTKPGLDQPVGNAAINSTPRSMIAEQVTCARNAAGERCALSVTVFAPEGERIGARTFNPHMGIEGGISILGTTGIVWPRSVAALIDSIKLEIRQNAALGHRGLVLMPGNYGKAFFDTTPELVGLPHVEYANYLGEALDAAAAEGFERVLVVGHSGKLAKVAGGIMDTHSRTADCRCEIICAHAACAGANTAVCRELMSCSTTDACLDVLSRKGLLGAVCTSLMGAIAEHLSRRAAGAFEVEAIMFSKQHGELGRTGHACDLIARMRRACGLEPVTSSSDR
ncbi:cobalt-precorrin-5B (C(1))-methyltransferase CbiD [Paratractidigestivibacter sp.]|uniref:cobalt-precorrin-5B (C(1))-methyltransferase CbiD n=1 Tax=Paratractidigestivibacter sp. TaxID=2847316 RepID=UPI002ABD6420|nr:cobalt-precorrin-5B (C(1))-methyltransferase CbiD [Paratractidigestivibacter sp.]